MMTWQFPSRYFRLPALATLAGLLAVAVACRADSDGAGFADPTVYPSPPLRQPAPPMAANALPFMVQIPAGCYAMGSPEGETGREDDEGRHRVCVNPFELGETEITLGQFARFVQETGYWTDAETSRDANALGCYSRSPLGGWNYVEGRSWRDPGFEQSVAHPVVCVSWNDAMRYIDWLNSITGMDYRLPSEAEWEYAVRAGAAHGWPWGGDPNAACRFENVADQAAAATYTNGLLTFDCRDGYVQAAPAGRFLPNAFGLYDMLGNVSEWTCSYYSAAYNGAESACSRSNAAGLRTNRGGSWSSKPDWSRPAVRKRLFTEGRADSLGFRIARTLPQGQTAESRSGDGNRSRLVARDERRLP